MKSPKVLLVDDEPKNLDACRRQLCKGSCTVVAAVSVREALRKITQESYAVVLVAFRRPTARPMAFLRKTGVVAPDVIRLVLAKTVDAQAAVDAVNSGAADRLVIQPWRNGNLRAAVRQAVAQHARAAGNRRTETALRQGKQRLQTVLDSVEVGVVIIDAKTYRILDANSKAVRMTGIPRKRVIGSVCQGFICPSCKGRCPVTDLHQTLNESGHMFLTGDGRSIPIMKTVKRMVLGNRDCLLETFVDISQRKEMETLVEDSRQRFLTLIDTVRDWMWEVDAQGVFTFCNSRVTDLLGYSLDETLEKTPFDFMVEEEAKRVEPIYRKLFAEKRPIVCLETTLLHRNGQPVVLETSGAPFFATDGSLLGYRGSSRDMTEIRQARERLLASELALAEAHERRRISNHLHDRICQYLVGAAMKLAALREPSISRPAAGILQGVSQLLEQSIGDVRLLISHLRPPAFDQEDFETAVKRLTRELSLLFGLQVRVQHGKRLKPMTNELQAVLFQALRELLINVAKHAQTQEAELSIQTTRKQIRITVKDRGVGFKPAEDRPPAGGGGGYGLSSIPERLKPVGGAFVIRSKPGQGTEATLIIPLPADRHAS